MPISSTNTVVAQYFEPEARFDQIVAAGINASGQFLIATPTGQNDQRMPYAELAVLVAGQGFKAVGGQLLHDIPALADGAAVTGAEHVIIHQGANAVKVTRDELLLGATGVTNLGIGTQGPSTLEVTSSSGTNVNLPMADGVNAGVLSAASYATFAAGSTTNLGIGAPSSTTVEITSSTGTSATIAQVSGTQAGVVNTTQFNKWDSAISSANLSIDSLSTAGFTVAINVGTNAVMPVVSAGQAGIVTSAQHNLWNNKIENVDLVVSGPDANTVTVTTDAASGAPQPLPNASATQAGVITSADFNRWDAAAGAGVDLGLGTRTDISLEVTNTAGANVTLPEATSSAGSAGLMTVAYAQKLEGIAPSANNYTHPDHGGVLVPTTGGDGDYALGPNSVDTAAIQSNAVDFDALQQISAQSIIGNATAGSADATAITNTLTTGTVGGSTTVVGWDDAGELKKFDTGDLSSSLKERTDVVGNQPGPTFNLDFDNAYTNPGHIKIITMTGASLIINLTASAAGSYEIWLVQDVTGGRLAYFDVALGILPRGRITVNPAPNSVTVIKLTQDHTNNWSW